MKFFLYPLAVIYNVITSFRNLMYDIGVFKSFHFGAIKTISVGNLTVGGTGKTPMIQFIIESLQDKYRIATLSRGYRRKTKGFLLANEKNEVSEIGDEPMQIFRRYPKVKVAVGEDRVKSVAELLSISNDIDLVLLDDAFQHRAIKPDLNILLTVYSNRFYKDFLMPYGLLRESRLYAKRADIVIVSKCPADIADKKIRKIERKIQEYIGSDKSVYFTYIKYAEPQPIYFSNSNISTSENVLLFSGIANPQPFVGYVSQNYNLKKFIKYPDHHHYSYNDVKHIIDEFKLIEGDSKCIITTEKDMVKLHRLEIYQLFKDLPVFFIPMEVKFLSREKEFLSELNSELVKK